MEGRRFLQPADQRGSLDRDAGDRPVQDRGIAKANPARPVLGGGLHAPYAGAEDWIFASPEAGGRRPYWGQSIMRSIIRPAARKLGITKRLGWHIFRHTYSTLLNA